jgi:ribosome recycling factor
VIDELLGEAGTKMDQAVAHTQGEFSTIRTGRANPSLLHRVMVDYYGTPTPLQQLASIGVPEPQMLVIQPFDPGSLGAIEKAIQAAGLGLNPSNDGTVIRLAFPPLTEERRKDIAKQVKNKGEEHKVAIRNIRRDANEQLKAQLKDKKITEDDQKRLTDKVQKETDEGVKKVDEIISKKEKEVMEV